jgi:hypothetical protein
MWIDALYKNCQLLKILKLMSCLAIMAQCSCVYRFTNKHIHVPDGAKTIAIAPIFDSSRIVIPHDVVWGSLQNAFASSGHLVVTGVNHADFFLQAHLKDGVTAEYESDAISTVRDPRMFIDPSTSQPYTPKSYVNLNAADIFSKRERLSFTVFVEIWDLRKRTLLLQKEYPLSSNFNMSTIPSTLESRYLHNEEVVEYLVSSLAKGFAQNVVEDLFATSPFSSQ